ncbi:MAG: AMP-binding protein [Spirochaetes bacterium]|nr:AMP-binding protein [Spirochaetota bacterium]
MFVKNYNKAAIITGDVEISYVEVIEKIKDYSFALKYNKGERIAIFFENRPEWIYSFFAGWNIGAVNVLIDAMSGKDELEYILNDCSPKTIITSNKNLDLVKKTVESLNYKPEIVNVDTYSFSKRERDVEEYQATPDETVLLLYTSGTTGSSKGVMLTSDNLTKQIRWTNDTKRINISDRVIAVLPTHHSWPLMSTVLAPLDCGATVVMLEKLDAQTLMSTIKKNKITKITAVPRLFEMLHNGIMQKINKNTVAKIFLSICKFLYKIPFNKILFGRVKTEYGKFDVIPLTRKIFKKVYDEFGGSMKLFLSGGAKLDEKIIEDFRAMGLPTVEGYGLTETSPMVTYHPFDKIRIGSVGVIFEQLDVTFDKDDEILIKGPNVMIGYWNKPEETKEVFTEDGYFKTGDFGILDKKGYLCITGRKKDIIVLSNGKNIRPDIIESKIKLNYGLVADIAITNLNNALFAVVVPNMSYAKNNNITNLTETIKFDVVDSYNKSVENYKKILDFMVTFEELPKTRIGKIKRFKLKEFVENNRRERRQASVEIPNYEEYAILSDYLKEVTGESPLPNDHIEIDLGLDSIEIIELQLYIEKSFGIALKEGELAGFTNIEKLAEYIQTAKTKVQRENINWKQILSKDIDWKLPVKIWALKIANFWFKLFLKRKINLKGVGVENIPAGPCIIAPNHTSFLDSLIIYYFLKKEDKKNVYFFAKEKNFRNSLFTYFAKRARIIIMDINKDLITSLQKIAQILKNGKKIVIFPEGTRSRDGKIQKFKNTFAAIAVSLNVPVVPVAINGAYESMPYTRLFPKRGNVTVEFLKSVLPNSLSENEIVKKIYGDIKEKLK